MRITFMQLLLAGILVCNAYAKDAKGQDILNKRISFSAQKANLKQVLLQIEELADVKFVYSSKAIDVNRRITISVSKQKLSELLDELIKPLNIRYKVIDDQILLYRSSLDSSLEELADIENLVLQSKAVNRTINGTVTNEKGDPLAGVSVLVAGTKKGTVTDALGKFSLSVADDDNVVLQVSYVGFQAATVNVGKRSELPVTLKELVAGLNDVVVVGYTSQKKKDITGAVSTINANDINDIPVGGVDQIMQGKAAGVVITQATGAPGDGVTVRIRGVGTINNNDPLYIVDGIPTKDGINEISPNDIETISILKDASSASIYGARASNGVVVITTKKGKIGKPRLSFNAYTGRQTRGHLIKMADTKQYVNAYNTAALADGRSQIPLGMLDSLPDVNWQKEVLKSAPMTNLQMSISGGNDNTRYIVSAAYFTQKGMIENSSNDRFNLRTSITSTLSKIFKVGTNVNLAYNKTRQVGSSGDGYGSGNPGPSVVRYALFRTPATPVFDKNGNYVDIPNPPDFFGDGLNPVGLAANTNRNFHNYSVLGDVFLEITPIKNLKIKSDFGTNFIITDYKQFYPTWGGGGAGTQGRLQNSPNSLAQSTVNNFNYNWTNTAVYDFIKNKHALNILAGTEIVFNDTRTSAASRTIFADQTSGFQYLNNGLGVQTNGGDESHWALSSLFSRLAYQYNEKYLATFNFRRDGSSRLDPHNRYGNFFSGSVGWRLDKENFMQNIKPISLLKLRASLGQLGNQEIGNYSYASLIGASGYYPFGNTSTSTYTIYSKGNPNVKWETSTIGDVGLDIGLLNGAINITADYYRKVTSNLLVAPPDPSSAGNIAAPAFANNGKILNRGFEFELSYRKKINNNWQYEVSGNLATIHNEVLALANNAPIAGGRVDNNVFATSTAVGHPIGEFYLLQQDGIFQTPLEVFTHAYQGPGIQPGDVKFKDANGDGVINSSDRVFAGSPIPKITYGFSGSLSFRQFDLGAFFQGVSGNKIYNQISTETEGFYRPFNITEKTATQSWDGEGTSNTQPRLSWNGAQNNKQTSTRFLENGSYLRLKNVQLGYKLSNEALSHLKIASMRFFISAQNIFTITKYTGLDPEMATSANAAAAGDGVKAVGIDWGTYPSARTFTIGANLNF